MSRAGRHRRRDRTPRRATSLLALSLALALGLGSGCSASTDGADSKDRARDPDAIETPTPRWVPCATSLAPPVDEGADPTDTPSLTGDEPPPLECGRITLPVDYGHPGRDTFELAFEVMRSATPEARRGILMINPGGPGQSGIDALRAAYLSWPEALLERYDVVAFDPRGISRSGANDCAAGLAGLRAVDPLPEGASAYAAVQAEIEGVVAAQLEAGECVAPALARAMGTANVARDMDVLRRVLGEPQLSFLGRSYGAWLGASYAGAFPDHVDRMALDAPPPPTADIRRWVLAFARAQQAVLEDAVARCPAGCELGDPDTFLARLDQTLRSLHAEPRALRVVAGDPRPIADTLTGADVVRAMAHLPYVDERSREVRLRDLARLDDPDPETRRQAEIAVAFEAQRSPVGLVRLESVAVLCADQTPRLDAPAVSAVVDTLAAEDNLFRSFALFMLAGCPAFADTPHDPPQLGEAADAVDLDGRVLVLGATEDGVTPVAAARELAREVWGGRVLVSEHDRHGTLYEGHNGCAQSLATAHLIGESVGASPELDCPYERDYDEPCEPLVPRSCRPAFKCGVYGPTTVPRCMGFSPGQLDASCFNAEYCDDGLHCTDVGVVPAPGSAGAVCRPVCLDDATCGESEVCSVVLPDLFGTCAPACDPFDDDCGDGLACKRLRTTIDGRGVAHCVPEGWLPAGSGCNSAAGCGAGLTCRADACRPLCDATHPCATGTCVPAGNDDLGHCDPG